MAHKADATILTSGRRSLIAEAVTSDPPSLKCIEFLVQQFPTLDVDSFDAFGRCPLMNAIENNSTRAVELLLPFAKRLVVDEEEQMKYVTFDRDDEYFCSSFGVLAVQKENPDILKLLIREGRFFLLLCFIF